MKKLIFWLVLCLLALPAAACADYVTLHSGEGSDLIRFDADDLELTVTEWNLIVETGDDGVIVGMYLYADIRNDGWDAAPLSGVEVVAKDGRVYNKTYGAYAHSYYMPEGGTSYYGDSILRSWGWNWDNEPPQHITLDDLESVTVILPDTLNDVYIDPNEGVLSGVTAEVRRLSPQWHGGERWEMLRVTVENHSGKAYSNPKVSVGAYDAQGRLIYAVKEIISVYDSDSDFRIPDGSGFVLDLRADDDRPFNVLDYLTQTGVEIAEYRVRLY